jgi:hypothetical protein
MRNTAASCCTAPPREGANRACRNSGKTWGPREGGRNFGNAGFISRTNAEFVALWYDSVGSGAEAIEARYMTSDDWHRVLARVGGQPSASAVQFS